jgi:hypothetical protein
MEKSPGTCPHPLDSWPNPRRPDSHRLLFWISHQPPSLQSFLQQQAQLELLARRVSLLEAIIWPGNGRAGRQGQPLPGGLGRAGACIRCLLMLSLGQQALCPSTTAKQTYPCPRVA